VARWKSAEHLDDHYGKHGRRLGYRSREEYDASAQRTLGVGRYFEFEDDDTGEARIGCYDAVRELLVILTTDDEIVSHFSATVRYVRDRPYSNYDEGER
jgi:hypothetical protein